MKQPQHFLVLLALFFLTCDLGAQTTITSDSLSVESGDDYNTFNFTQNVNVKGEDTDIHCDHLIISSKKSPENKDNNKEMGSIEKIVALGHVTMKQEGRQIRAGRAEICPQEGKVILEENPEVEDEQGLVKGYRMVLNQGERMAHIEGNPNGERPSVLLPELPDFGLGSPKKSRPAENNLTKK